LPHLRNAVYQHLIEADNLLESKRRGDSAWVECTVQDYDFDGTNEVRLANDQLVAWLAPGQGGMLYEYDLRDNRHNLLASMQRRPESYHEKVRQGQIENTDQTASIHDRIVFKQAGLENCLDYDRHLRKSLIDHFWDRNVMLAEVMHASATEQGDFVQSVYQATVRRNPDRIQVVLKRDGNVAGKPISVTKGITMQAGRSELEFAYMVEGLPAGIELLFGIEFNFAGMPDGQADRYFLNSENVVVGQLGTTLDLPNQAKIELVDHWLNLSASLHFQNPTSIWAFPIRSVSQSESGFELVHQSVVVQPHWVIRGDRNGRWVTRFAMRTQAITAKNGPRQEEPFALARSGR
jgi:alpha-amylase